MTHDTHALSTQSALFNELYCLVSGGTVWLQDELSAKQEKPETDGQEEGPSDVGRWACLESQEVRNAAQPLGLFNVGVGSLTHTRVVANSTGSTTPAMPSSTPRLRSSPTGRSCSSPCRGRSPRTRLSCGPSTRPGVLTSLFRLFFFSSFFLFFSPMLQGNAARGQQNGGRFGHRKAGAQQGVLLSTYLSLPPPHLHEACTACVCVCGGACACACAVVRVRVRRGCREQVRGAVPYDMGTPADDPWVVLNAYNIHDTSTWKGKLGLFPASHLQLEVGETIGTTELT